MSNIEIPDRPSVSTQTRSPGSSRRRLLLFGGIAALALIVLATLALMWHGGSARVANSPEEAPLIKAEEEPIKVSPDSPGGMQVPNRDIMIYNRMHGTPGSKPPVERLLPEPEKPLRPPEPKSPDALRLDEPPVAMGETGRIEPPPEAPAAPALLPEAETPVAKPPAGPAIQPKEKAPAPAPLAAKPRQPKTETKSAEPKAETKTAEAKPGDSAPAGRFQVQLFSGRSMDEAQDAWAQLKAKNQDTLASLSPSFARADLGDRGIFYRLRAGPIGSEAQARSLCDRLAGRGTSCIIVRPGG